MANLTLYEELSNEILASPEFKQKYEKLVKIQYPDSQMEELSFDDIRFLLKSGSIFAFSSEERKKLAYKIATIIAERYSESYDGINRAVQYIIISSGQMPALLKNIDDCEKDYFSIYNESKESFNPLAFKHIIVKQALNKAPEKVNGGAVFFTDFQRDSFDALEEGKSISISAPTSAGKSFLLISYLSKKFREAPRFNVIYIVPTRALITQVQRDMKRGLKEFNIDDVLVTSTSNVNKENKKTKRLFVLTQERLHNLLFDGEFQEPIDIMIIDEAQKVSDSSRGILLEEVIESVINRNEKKKHALQKLFISPFAKNPEKYAEMFNLKDLQPAKTRLSPVSQNLLQLDIINDNEYNLDLIDEGFEKEKIRINNGTIDFALKNLFSGNADWKLLWAAKAFGTDSNIIYCNTQRSAVENALVFSESLERLNDIEINEVIKFLEENVHSEYYLIKCLRKGVGYHYGSMPPQIRELVETLFKSKKIKFIFCTSTLLEGVNLPAKNIFISRPRQGREGMTQLNFWNLAGRAGRLLKDYYGNIYCIDIEQWPGYKPNPKDVEHTIESIFETAVRNKKIIEYLKDIYKTAKEENAATEQAITKFIIQEIRGEGTQFIEELIRRKIDPEHLQEIQQGIKELASTIQVPPDIIQKNLSINPIKQQRLLESFKLNKPPLPLYPNQKDFYKNLEEIYRIVDEHFESTQSKQYKYYAFLTSRWINGNTIRELINSIILPKLEGKVKPTPEMINKAIDQLFRDIDDRIRYKYQKDLKCYIDLLRLFYKDDEKLSEINDTLPMYLEFGTHKKNILIMQAMGISRSTALMLDKFTENLNFEGQTDCINWLKSNNEELSRRVPKFVWSEVEEII